MRKLSARQQRVVQLLKEGWELGVDTSWGLTYCQLQQGGIGHGGKTEEVHLSTWKALRKHGIIEVAPREKEDGFNLTRYRLKRG